MSDHPILREAEFDRTAIKKYYLIQPVIVMICTVVMIPLIPVVVFFVWLLIDKYLDRLSCTLTERTIEIRKGVLNRIESTVPLEKVTDLMLFQGPIMRMLGLQGFRVETAGQSAGATGSLVNMIGIVDTPGFRRMVLTQRDRVVEGGRRRGAASPAGSEEIDEARVLVEIRDMLGRIEQRLSNGG